MRKFKFCVSPLVKRYSSIISLLVYYVSWKPFITHIRNLVYISFSVITATLKASPHATDVILLNRFSCSICDLYSYLYHHHIAFLHKSVNQVVLFDEPWIIATHLCTTVNRSDRRIVFFPFLFFFSLCHSQVSFSLNCFISLLIFSRVPWFHCSCLHLLKAT